MIILVSNHIISQNFQGKAYYFSKTSPDMSGWGNGQILMHKETDLRQNERYV